MFHINIDVNFVHIVMPESGQGGISMKKWFKKAFAIGMAGVMSVGLCACGGGGSGRGNGSRGSSVNAELAKEGVYKLHEIDMPQFVDETNGYVNMYNIVHQDGKIYIWVEVNDWTREENVSDIRVVSMNEDGSGIEMVSLDTSTEISIDDLLAERSKGDSDSQEPDEETAPEEPGDDSAAAEPGDASAAEESDKDSASEEAGKDTGMRDQDEEKSDEDVANDEDYSYSNVWEYTSFSRFVMTSDKKTMGVKDYYYEDYNDPDNYFHINKKYICCWNTDGSLDWEKELEELSSQEEGAEWRYVSDVLVDKNNEVTLLISGDNPYKITVSGDGEVSGLQPLSEQFGKILYSRRGTVTDESGKMMFLYSDENDWTKSFLISYDPASDTFGDPVEMPKNFGWNGFNNLSAGIDSDLIYNTSEGVFTYNAGDEESVKKMDYINSDVNITYMRGFIELDSQSFLGLYEENYSNELKGGIFTYVDPKDIPDKAVIVLGGNYVDNDLRQRAIEYNRDSDVYRIVIRDYQSYNSYDDYNASITKLNNDIITGDMPDILVTSGLPVENYIAKGLIADVSKLIKQDEELSQVEFIQNVFDAYSVKGKLYYVVPNFSVSTVVVKSSLVGDRTGWTMEDMQNVLAELGDETQPFTEVTRDGFMSMAMSYCGNEFVDVSTGKCSFNSDNFIAMMEFAKTLPEEMNWDEIYGDGSYWENYDSQWRENRTLMNQLYIGNFTNLNYQLNGYMGEPVSFVGFPMEDGKGSYISAMDSFALSARSANLDGAWDFVRYYLTDEYQEELSYGLPVNKRVFMEKSLEAMKKRTYTDENGNEVEYDETFWMNGEEIPLPPLSQEQVNQVVEFVMSVDKAYYYNENVLNIINEEMGAFYTGQKSAQDVANVIQSRVQLYVDENR